MDQDIFQKTKSHKIRVGHRQVKRHVIEKIMVNILQVEKCCCNITQQNYECNSLILNYRPHVNNLGCIELFIPLQEIGCEENRNYCLRYIDDIEIYKWDHRRQCNHIAIRPADTCPVSYTHLRA